MTQEQRGLRFPFSTDAEVTLESSPENIQARVTELSFRGCFIETSFSLKQQQRIQIKIYRSDQYFEALAQVIYLRPTGGGLVFCDMKPHSRNVLQAWILAALDDQVKPKLT